MELYYVGNKDGLMKYLRSKMVCEYCQGSGVIQKTEWTGTDTSYEVDIICQCMQD